MAGVFFALFAGADFAAANFSGADFSGADFSGALGFAVFTGFSAAAGFLDCSAAFCRAALLANCASRIARS